VETQNKENRVRYQESGNQEELTRQVLEEALRLHRKNTRREIDLLLVVRQKHLASELMGKLEELYHENEVWVV
jgi:hypothetical protein